MDRVKIDTGLAHVLLYNMFKDKHLPKENIEEILKEYHKYTDKKSGKYISLLVIVEYFKNNTSFAVKDIIQLFTENMNNHGIYRESKFKVSCFSERNDSLLMWAYYAKAYSGACLQFKLSEDEQLAQAVQKVRYCDTLGVDITNPENLFRKSTEWAHEQEWRLVCENNIEYLPTNSISAILIGPHIRHDNFLKTLIASHKYKIPVYFVRPENRAFHLEVIKAPSVLDADKTYTDEEYEELYNGLMDRHKDA